MTIKARIFTKWISTISLALLTSCAEVMPGLFKAVEDIETDQAVRVEIDKEAIQKDTNIHVIVDIVNKDQTPAKP